MPGLQKLHNGAKAAVKKADDIGNRQVKDATLFGNAWLPQAGPDAEIRNIKADMVAMREHLKNMDKVFLSLRPVAPKCDGEYKKCGLKCDKEHPQTQFKEAVFAIMNKVTECQMKCKQTVVDCVMQAVSSTYSNVTGAAMTSVPTL